MKKNRTLLAAVCGLLFCLLASLFPPLLAACKVLQQDKQRVGEHFDVVLRDRGSPVVGLGVVIERWRKRSETWEQMAQAVTDETGTARFTGLRSGSYWVKTDTPVENDSREIEVTTDGSKTVERVVELSWPSKEVMVTKNLKGRLTSFLDAETPPESLGGVTLTALEAHSGQIAAVGVTEQDGSFKFDGLAPGLYFLRLTGEGNQGVDVRIWGRKLSGNIAVEYNPINPEAHATVQLRLMMVCFSHLSYMAAD